MKALGLPAESRSAPDAGEQRLVRLVAAHQAALYRYLLYLGCDATLAEDLVQETFLAAWEKRWEDRGPSATAAWLRTIARNRFYSHVRRRRVRPAFHDLAAADAAWAARHGEDDGEAVLDALRACLDGLTAKVRTVLDGFYRDRHSRERIARDTGMTANGVKTLLRRTRGRLRDCVTRRLEA